MAHIVCDHTVELLFRDRYSVAVGTVDDDDDELNYEIWKASSNVL